MADKGYKRRITLEFDYASVQNGVPDTTKQIQVLNQTFSAANAEANAYGTGLEKLGVKHDYLKKKIELINSELTKNKERLEQAKKSGSPDAVQKYTVAVARSEAALKKAGAELVLTNKELKKQAEFLGKNKGEWDKLAEGFDKTGKTLSKTLTAPIMLAGAGAIKAAADFEQTMGKVDVVFGESSEAVKRWSQNSIEKFGLARGSALGAAADFGAMAKNFGFTGDQVAKISTDLSARMMDFATFTNASVDEVKTAFEGAFTGNSASLKRFGIVMNQATLEQYAYTHGMGRQIDKMSEAQKVMLRYNFIMEQTSQAVGNTKRESDSFSGQMAMMKETVKELGENFGKILLPVITPIIKGINDLFKRINSLDSGTKTFIVTLLGVVAAFGPMLIMFSKLIKAGSTISTALSATGGFGFIKWAAIIMGVVLAITLLITALNVLLGKGNETARAFGSVRQNMGMAQQNLIPAHAAGSNFIAQDHIALVHRGEAIIPAKNNPWNPAAAAPYGGGGDTFNLNVQMDEVDEVSKLVRVVNGLKQSRRSAYGYN